MIICFMGPKQNGKDTGGRILKRLYPDMHWTHRCFANPFKKFSHEVFGWDKDYMENHKEEEDPEWGISPRQFWQYMGTEVGQYGIGEHFPKFKEIVGRCLWVMVCMRKIKPGENTLITDLRFPHEVACLKKKFKVVVIKVVRGEEVSSDNHPSEQEQLEIKYDYLVRNDGTKKQYKEALKPILKEILGY